MQNQIIEDNQTMPEKMNTIVHEPDIAAKWVIIWLHGLGADGHDFEPIIPTLNIPSNMPIRYIFPCAPLKPVTINNHALMPAWYDILSLEKNGLEDQAGILASEKLIQTIIEEQINQGIASTNIFLGGFSQGGALALFTGLRYPQPLAGIFGLSTYLPIANYLFTDKNLQQRNIPLFLAHGTHDILLPLHIGETCCSLLQEQHFQPEWNTYPMEHIICEKEILDFSKWLVKSIKINTENLSKIENTC